MSVEIGNIHLHSSPDGDLRRDIDLRMKALHSDIVMADVHITYYQVYKSYWNARVIWKSKIQTLTTSNVVNYEQFIQLIKHSNLNITLDKKSALIKINQDMNNLSSVNYSRYLISDQISQNTANLVYFYFCHNRDRNHSKQLFQGLFEKVLTVL
jgi:ribosomal protein L20